MVQILFRPGQFHNNYNKISTTMLNYKNSTTSYNKLNNSDLPTAVKSNYYDYSPHGQDIGTPSLKSPSRSIVKLQEAKNSISSMINEMSNKKNQNMDAIERVRAINSEALGFVSNEQYQNYTPKKSQRDQYRGAPQYAPINPEGGYATQFNLQGGDDGNYEMLNHGESGNLTLEQQNIELRRALNQQIRQNNELLKRIKYLELENDDLRTQLGQDRQGTGLYTSKGLRSTNYNSVNYGDASRNLGRAEYPSSATAQFYGSPRNNNNNIDFPQLGQTVPLVTATYNYPEGFKLNTTASMPRKAQGYKVGPTIAPQHSANQRELYTQLDELKQENERLRQNAIEMLKSTH